MFEILIKDHVGIKDQGGKHKIYQYENEIGSLLNYAKSLITVE